MFIGLVFEKMAEWMNERFLGEGHPHKGLNELGWILLMIGIAVEIADAGFAANEGWQIRQMAIKNDPLKQPISDVSAILRLEVSSTNIDVKNPIGLEHTIINFFGTNINSTIAFSLGTKEGRYFRHLEHLDYPTGNFGHIVAYGIAVRFELNPLPVFEMNDLSNTNDTLQPNSTVANAMSQISKVEAYVDFLPTNTIIIRGSVHLKINGFQKDFEISSNSINREMSLCNPDKAGFFLDATNFTP